MTEPRYEKEIGEWTTKFAVGVIKICGELRKHDIDKDVISLFRRSGTSVGANVNEGKGSGSKKELLRYYRIAHRSANETIFWTKVIEGGYEFKSEKFESCKNELKQIKNVLSTIIIKLGGK